MVAATSLPRTHDSGGSRARWSVGQLQHYMGSCRETWALYSYYAMLLLRRLRSAVFTQPPQPLLPNGMLLDGSNPEGLDPCPPLGWRQASDLQNVVLYGVNVSPPSTKIRAHLIHYQVPFKFVTTGHGKKSSCYTKVPVLDVADGQVNESSIIVKHLMLALTGSFDQEWEERITLELQFSLEYAVMSSPSDAWLFVSEPYGFGMPSPIVCCALPLIRRLIKTGIENNPKARLIDVNAFASAFAREIGQKPFFHGQAPGQVDLSFYGTCAPFYVSGCPLLLGMIASAGLDVWWARMETRVPLKGASTALYP
mmetsp:Transcript_112514/g.317788  ORF Transcript_112514/g.317788 Transcript_112514/m.317788 type:complete len:310 (-) Transcript_112514:161-1090(-)|eukprot:CAMPEP_0117467854 /NCGR_PEP_ID=MMETSP0784-20121206/5874_1 /TAXON_ID=39447 /ORGANISM="" /LENGTH=309 /DNA_ID=CAMNT_0005261843 /DNA_START=1 /DNA_END=930 /DNA_ORIENTATION=-